MPAVIKTLTYLRHQQKSKYDKLVSKYVSNFLARSNISFLHQGRDKCYSDINLEFLQFIIWIHCQIKQARKGFRPLSAIFGFSN